MKKVAVFGNAGAGKSTTSLKIAEKTNLPLYALDKMKFASGGDEIPHDSYLAEHTKILADTHWLMEGYGCLPSTWERLEAADTLVYLDLPIYLHFCWVTKRFFKGLFSPPEGWPDNTPLLKATLTSYQVLWLCHRKLTPSYRKFVKKAKNNKSKTVYHLRSKSEIADFINSLE